MKTILILVAGWALANLAEANPSQSCNGLQTNYNRQPQLIPGTNLHTRTFYTLRMKRFPKGIVTWADYGKDTYNYVQLDNSDQIPKYKPGGEFHNDSIWEFIPVVHCGQETGWYGLRNRGRKGAYITYAPNDYVEGSQNAYHMIMERNFPGQRSKTDFFLKLVEVLEGAEVFYQIKLKNLPDGMVKWSQTKYGDYGAHYIEVDVHNDSQHMQNYNKGGAWYEDTLFTVGDPEQENAEEGGLGDLETQEQQ